MSKSHQKITDFIDLLKKRTIEQIENTDIKESCTATLLFIFAGIDSLSKITCDDNDYALLKQKKGNKVRFIDFLKNVMGNKYSTFSGEIYDLRNDLVHTGINTKVVLSKNSKSKEHLQEMKGYLWINTQQFLNDFKESLKQISDNITNGDIFFQNAMDRLREFNIIEVYKLQDGPSPGPEDEFFQ
jgi:hypothetical protein